MKQRLVCFPLLLAVAALACAGLSPTPFAHLNVNILPASGSGPFSLTVTGDVDKGNEVTAVFCTYSETGASGGKSIGSAPTGPLHVSAAFEFNETQAGDYVATCTAWNQAHVARGNGVFAFKVTQAGAAPAPTETSTATTIATGTATATATTAKRTAATPTATQPKAQALALANPGFEDGILGWTDLHSSCGSKSDADNTVAHSGRQSRRLYLRYCGSYISQHVGGDLPAGSTLSLLVWVKMPFAGTKETKYLTLNLVADGAAGGKLAAKIDQFAPLADWTQLTVGPLTPSFAVNGVDVILETDHGNGAYQGFDHPVWLDDLQLSIQTP